MIHLPPAATDLSLALIRIVVAISFIVASKNKSKNIKKFAKNNGLSVPVAIFLATAELAGGLAVAFGIFSQYAAAGLMLLLLGTMRLHIFKWRSPYWAAKGGWEYDLMLFALLSVVFIHGPGTYAVMPGSIFS